MTSTFSCQNDGYEVKFQCSDNEDVCELAESNNDFGWDIFKVINDDKTESNIFISPFSISTALSMTLNGAKGETKDEMIKVLQYNGWDLNKINSSYKALLEVLPYLDDKVKMRIANSIWYRQGFNVLPEFLDINKNNYDAEIRAEDFNNPETKDIINGWVENKTEGKIKDIIKTVDPNTVMFLINAIYFKGNWKYEFDKKKTFKGDFNLQGGDKIKTDFMSINEITLPYYNSPNFDMIDIPYGDSIYSMSIIMPDNGISVDELVDEMDIVTWSNAIDNLRNVEMTLTIPKFKIENKEYLKETLRSLGMKKVFNPSQADLSGINGTGGLWVSKVIHQSFVEVDEKGTEAAAATVVAVELKASPIVSSFVADKPFLFVIRDNATNSILFIGKVINPSLK